MADAAAGPEDHDRFIGFEAERVIQATKRGHRIHGQSACLLAGQVPWDARDVVSFDGSVLGVAPTLGFTQAKA